MLIVMKNQLRQSEITWSQVFGDVIRYYREKHSFSQQDFAIRIKESIGFVKHLELGVQQFHNRIHQRRFELIANVLEKSPEELSDICDLAFIDFGLSKHVEYLNNSGEQIHKIRYIRLQNGMTVDELAAACRVSSYMIRKIELFKTRISPTLWDKIRHALEIDSITLRQTEFRPIRDSIPQKSYDEDWLPEHIYDSD